MELWKNFELGHVGANQCARQPGTVQPGLCIGGASRRLWVPRELVSELGQDRGTKNCSAHGGGGVAFQAESSAGAKSGGASEPVLR